MTRAARKRTHEERCAVVTEKGQAIYQLNAAEYGLDPMQSAEQPDDSER